MFGRLDKTMYAERLAGDDKLRNRLVSALAHATVAARRTRQQTGTSGLARRLASDRELHEQLRMMARELGKARTRIERGRRGRTRTIALVAGGSALALGLALQARRRLRAQRLEHGARFATIDEWIEIDVPLRTAYDQWTQFEEFPLFMEGVDHVEQLDDTRLRWVATVAGRRAEWEAKILEQEPDRRIVWQSLDGRETRGTIAFEPLGEARTRVHLSMSYRPEGMLEQAGSAAGLDQRRVRGDLERFKQHIESQRVESGAWRGEIKGGQTT